MMKNLLTVIALAFSIQSFGQVIVMEGGHYTHHKAVRTSSTQKELHDLALDWVQDHMDETHGQIKFDNEDRGKIVMHGFMDQMVKGKPAKVEYDMEVQFRSGVFKETFTHFTYSQGAKSLPLESNKVGGKKKIIEVASSEVENLSASLIDYMSQKN